MLNRKITSLSRVMSWTELVRYDSFRRDILYNVLNEFGIPLELASLIKMCLNETYRRVLVGKRSSDVLHVKNGFKQGDALSSLIFNFALECAIRRVRVNQGGLKLNGTHQLLVFCWSCYSILLDESVHAMKKITVDLVLASKEIGLEVLVKLSILSCLESRMQDKFTI
jgi:hypothetical protein